MNSSRPHARRVALHTYVGVLLLASAVAAHADITLFISDSQGPRGGSAPITVSLQGDGRDVAGVDIDLLFDAVVFGVPAHVTDICAAADTQVHICLGGDNNFQQCTTNSNCPGGICNNAFAVTGTVDVPAPPEGKHRLALSITQPIMNPPPPPIPLGNGAIIVCNLAVLSDAPLGTTVVEGSGPAAFDSNAVSLTPISVGSAEGETGTVTITEALPTETPTAVPTETPTPISCKIDTDCPPSQICLDQRCETQGCSDTECPPPRVCVNNVCVPPTCTSDTDCAPPAICVNQACQNVPCDICPSGYVCNLSTNTCALATPTPITPPTDTPTPLPSSTPTITPLPNTATPTKTVTPTITSPPNTATPTTTRTPTAEPTATPTRTNTVLPTLTATRTSAAPGGAADKDGCSISRSGSGASLLWLLIPAAVVVWRRRR